METTGWGEGFVGGGVREYLEKCNSFICKVALNFVSKNMNYENISIGNWE